MDFEGREVGNIRSCKGRTNNSSRMLPERPIHRKHAFSKERQCWPSSQRLDTIVGEIQGMNGLIVLWVISVDCSSAHADATKRLPILVEALFEAVEKALLLEVLNIIQKEIEAKNWILMGVTWRSLASELFHSTQAYLS